MTTGLSVRNWRYLDSTFVDLSTTFTTKLPPVRAHPVYHPRVKVVRCAQPAPGGDAVLVVIWYSVLSRQNHTDLPLAKKSTRRPYGTMKASIGLEKLRAMHEKGTDPCEGMIAFICICWRKPSRMTESTV